jgi:hypothetical protein
MRLRTVFIGFMQRCVVVQCIGWTVSIIRYHYVCMHTRKFTTIHTTIPSMLMPKNTWGRAKTLKNPPSAGVDALHQLASTHVGRLNFLCLA